MITRSRRCLVSNPITYSSVMHWSSTPRGMQYPHPKKTTGHSDPLNVGCMDVVYTPIRCLRPVRTLVQGSRSHRSLSYRLYSQPFSAWTARLPAVGVQFDHWHYPLASALAEHVDICLP